MIEIHLYGKLRRSQKGADIGRECVIKIDPEKSDTIESLLKRAGIDINDLYHVFYNSRLLSSKSSMAKVLGYQQEREDPSNWDLNVAVKPGDRLGLFGSDMSALVV